MDRTYDLQSHLNDIEAALAVWEARDDSRAQPEVRRAANAAWDAIDAMLRDLQALRSRLAGEIRASDDAAHIRVDAMLATPMRRWGETPPPKPDDPDVIPLLPAQQARGLARLRRI
jgi:hypothetical protein